MKTYLLFTDENLNLPLSPLSPVPSPIFSTIPHSLPLILIPLRHLPHLPSPRSKPPSASPQASRPAKNHLPGSPTSSNNTPDIPQHPPYPTYYRLQLLKTVKILQKGENNETFFSRERRSSMVLARCVPKRKFLRWSHFCSSPLVESQWNQLHHAFLPFTYFHLSLVLAYSPHINESQRQSNAKRYGDMTRNIKPHGSPPSTHKYGKQPAKSHRALSLF